MVAVFSGSPLQLVDSRTFEYICPHAPDLSLIIGAFMTKTLLIFNPSDDLENGFCPFKQSSPYLCQLALVAQPLEEPNPKLILQILNYP